MNHLEISAGLSGKLEQRTILSQTQRRSLEMLAMPVAALDEFLNAELPNLWYRVCSKHPSQKRYCDLLKLLQSVLL